MTESYPVLEGAEPFYFEGNSVGILVSHGFTGSTQSMRPLGEAYASVGYTVCGPRLRGHGTHHEDMEQTTYQDWIASVEEGYSWLKERCETVFVTGLSMGGTLTLYMAEQYPEIRGIVLINAAVEIPAMEPVLELEGTRFLDAIGSDIKKAGVLELAYEKTPVQSIKEILPFMKTVKENLSKVYCPALIFVSDEDHVVPPDNSQTIYDRISSETKAIHHMKESYHVATLDNDQQMIIDKTLELIKKQL
ncbi:alpha/beta fold hydrolase [Mesobacillus subterraneus]|uniref:alpha/beta hydrolase n=1 Tax=Mesobacillus subterraneus TaxID=285983 RepID=UPI001CFF0218|nr:alpha/beta fold hydrolase [Mesobacillus subterraneus]WLR56430.1 alpha/beta fold hydrolase [Mesobacillus subterraneus]